MKRLSLLICFLAITYSCSLTKLGLKTEPTPTPGDYISTLSDSEYSRFQAIQTSDTRVEMEGEGMYFIIENILLPPSEKSIAKIRKAYMPAGDRYEFKNIEFEKPSLTLLGGRDIGTVFSTTSLLFIVPSSDTSMYAIFVESTFLMNYDLSAKLVKEISEKGIPKGFTTTSSAESVDFVGRTISLGNVCGYIKPHHIGCKDLGNIQWMLLNNKEDALMAMQIEMVAQELEQSSIVSNDEVNVVFEDMPVVANKIVYKSKEGTKESGDLICYYINCVLREQPVFCKVSFFESEIKSKGLSPLAAKVLKLP